MKNKTTAQKPNNRTKSSRDERIEAIITLHPRKAAKLPLMVELVGEDWERLAQCAKLAKVSIDTIASKLLAFEYFGDSVELLSKLQDGEKLKA